MSTETTAPLTPEDIAACQAAGMAYFVSKTSTPIWPPGNKKTFYASSHAGPSMMGNPP